MTEQRETAAMAVKFIYRKKGKDVLTGEEIVLSLSTDQSWLSPEEAKNFLKNCIGRGLLKLEKESDGISPTQEVTDAVLPKLAFSPDIKHMQEWAKKQDLFQLTLGKIVSLTGMEKKQVIAEANVIQKRLNIDVKVAMLMVAIKHGLDVSDIVGDIEQDLIERRINEEENS